MIRLVLSFRVNRFQQHTNIIRFVCLYFIYDRFLKNHNTFYITGSFTFATTFSWMISVGKKHLTIRYSLRCKLMHIMNSNKLNFSDDQDRDFNKLFTFPTDRRCCSRSCHRLRPLPILFQHPGQVRLQANPGQLGGS